MAELPDFSNYGYQMLRELGHNRAGGRVTYLAAEASGTKPVVIKQFQFAKAGSAWAEYEIYNREVQVLQSLNHPGIPRYLASLETPEGFCMVQEYKDAPSLATARSFSAAHVKTIAEALLEILVYLQERVPVVIHRDLKPENILVDEQLRVYLVDFGFAHSGPGEVAMSSVAKGTLGFMPPEQLLNRQLTEASDLYGLGATLICLVTGTKSFDVGQLINEQYRFSFQHLLPGLDPAFCAWLQKLVELNPKDRYLNAAAALDALHSLGQQAQDTLLAQREETIVVGAGHFPYFSLALVYLLTLGTSSIWMSFVERGGPWVWLASAPLASAAVMGALGAGRGAKVGALAGGVLGSTAIFLIYVFRRGSGPPFIDMATVLTTSTALGAIAGTATETLFRDGVAPSIAGASKGVRRLIGAGLGALAGGGFVGIMGVIAMSGVRVVGLLGALSGGWVGAVAGALPGAVAGAVIAGAALDKPPHSLLAQLKGQGFSSRAILLRVLPVIMLALSLGFAARLSPFLALGGAALGLGIPVTARVLHWRRRLRALPDAPQAQESLL
ncbi:serine/threonine protein kinase [Anthocerotibacter panamensis]|uniref:serine/threonine protein kinase n=1 Tax=Anthocerotibacter panamensis TaxID=2857077 RepID=UPI001C405524|nr:serine/threonine-protein kinase [Anthocerotibacter panamensis]